MKNKARKIATKLGVDKAILFTSFSRVIQGAGGIISVLIVASFLTDVEQGFYYTFASILAIQVFFELGLNGIITQYVAHEVSHLTEVNNKYVGSEKHLSRMTSILHFAIKWYLILSFFVFALLLTVGFVFFSHFYKSKVPIDWLLPWFILSFSTTLYFAISPIIAFVEGLGKVKEVAKIRLMQQSLVMFLTWGGLVFGMKLYVGGIAALAGVAVLIFFVIYHFLPLLHNIYLHQVTEKLSYKEEILPFQWKIALSWIGGYFIFQLFNPVIFATEGAAAAGQMGMTLNALTSILALSFGWMATKIPVYSGYIAQRDFKKLNKLFNTTFFQSSFVIIFAMVGLFVVIFGIRYFNVIVVGKNLGDKFLPYLPMVFMMISFLMNHIIGSLAVYLRCHKKEPMLVHSLVFGALSCISTVVLGKYYGVIGITAGYCFITIGVTFWAYYIFITKKSQWHKDEK